MRSLPIEVVVSPWFALHLLIMRSYWWGRIDRFVQPTSAEVVFSISLYHPVHDMNETALASRQRYADKCKFCGIKNF